MPILHNQLFLLTIATKPYNIYLKFLYCGNPIGTFTKKNRPFFKIIKKNISWGGGMSHVRSEDLFLYQTNFFFFYIHLTN